MIFTKIFTASSLNKIIFSSTFSSSLKTHKYFIDSVESIFRVWIFPHFKIISKASFLEIFLLFLKVSESIILFSNQIFKTFSLQSEEVETS